MAETLAAEPTAARSRSAGLSPFDHLTSFRVIYGAIFAFALLYVLSVEVAESLLRTHFQREVARAVEVRPVDGPVQIQIQNRVTEMLASSRWIWLGGVQVNVTVLGADGKTPLYLNGARLAPPPPAPNLEVATAEAMVLLPPITDVIVSVPHGSVLSAGILLAYASLLLQVLFVHNRARSIEDELAQLRQRQESETAGAPVDEIRALEAERESLRTQLRALARREASLRAGADRASALEEERQALEELLDEALEDVGQKESEIQELQSRLRSTSKKAGASAKGRAREAERIARRLRTLYKNLDVEDRAIEDLASLGDESLKLRAEEGLKRLSDDPDTAAVRRKVGGLPPQLAIYELGFAGKGRVYYTRADSGRYRILAIGGKATQKQDLEYLSRLSP